VSIEEDFKVIPSTAIEAMGSELKKIAEHVKIIFLTQEDMNGYDGRALCNLHSLRGSLDKWQNKLSSQPVRQIWYNPWDCSTQHTILLLHDMYVWTTVQDGCELRVQFPNILNLAIGLVHELAHVCVRLWRPEISHHDETLISASDRFPEAWNYWKHLVFGGPPTNMMEVCSNVENWATDILPNHQFPGKYPHRYWRMKNVLSFFLTLVCL
jgi:hypothetical protein